MDIRTALDRLVVVQKSLTLVKSDGDPIDEAVVVAHKYWPDRSVAIETPGWINGWTFVDEELYGGDGSAGRTHRYVVHSQFFVHDADLDQAADIASAFHARYMTALDADVQLNGTVTLHTFRGGDPTLALLEWSGGPYIGLDYFHELLLSDTTTIGR